MVAIDSEEQDKTIGLVLALISSCLIGASFIITKKGLMDANAGVMGGAGDSHSYLRNYKWWAGMLTMTLGEAANFAAYTYAPAILVTPLGAGSVLVGAILSSIFLGEKLGSEGVIGCALCILGSIVIILHSPDEKKVTSVDEILSFAMNPLFLAYVIISVLTVLILIFKVAPRHGKTNMFVYIAICSLVGSISVMACKAFGIALSLSAQGMNQFSQPSTYMFLAIVIVAILVQMNYFNKALDLFSTNRVTPIYYVFFTTATIFASAVLFDSFHTDPDNQKKPNPDGVKNIVSVIAGFITIFIGVFMLNSKKSVEVNRGSSIALRSLGHRNSFSLAISGSRSRMDINEHHLLKNMSSAHPNSDEEEMN